MRIAMYARVSTQRQAQTQTIEQQLTRLQVHCQAQGWQWQDEHVFRDDGYSGATLKRPGLDRLREQVRQAAFDRVLITAPDRLARNYVHQMLLIEELEQGGCLVEFVERPMSQDPHDQLLNRNTKQEVCCPGPGRLTLCVWIPTDHVTQPGCAWRLLKRRWWPSCLRPTCRKARASLA